MTSPYIEACAASTRTESEVRGSMDIELPVCEKCDGLSEIETAFGYDECGHCNGSGYAKAAT